MSLWIIVVIALVLSLQIIISIIMYFKQDRLIFKAEKLPSNYQFSMNGDFEEINLLSEDGNTLNGLLYKVSNPKGVIIYFHSFSGNIAYWTKCPNLMNSLGYDLLIMDYRNFGKSTGSFNETHMYVDARQWYAYLLKKYPENKITIFGRGLGCAIATHIASINNPQRLILESPLYSMSKLIKYYFPLLPIIRYIVKYKLNTAKYMIDVKCKVHIFHGDKDDVVAYKDTIKLGSLVKNNIAKVQIIKGCDHFDLQNNKEYLEGVKKILKE